MFDLVLHLLLVSVDHALESLDLPLEHADLIFTLLQPFRDSLHLEAHLLLKLNVRPEFPLIVDQLLLVACVDGGAAPRVEAVGGW